MVSTVGLRLAHYALLRSRWGRKHSRSCEISQQRSITGTDRKPSSLQANHLLRPQPWRSRCEECEYSRAICVQRVSFTADTAIVGSPLVLPRRRQGNSFQQQQCADSDYQMVYERHLVCGDTPSWLRQSKVGDYRYYYGVVRSQGPLALSGGRSEERLGYA